MASEIKVGSAVVHVERLGPRGKAREILRTTVVRETKTQWITDDEWRWNKGSRALVPQHKLGSRYIVAAEDFDGVAS